MLYCGLKKNEEENRIPFLGMWWQSWVWKSHWQLTDTERRVTSNSGEHTQRYACLLWRMWTQLQVQIAVRTGGGWTDVNQAMSVFLCLVCLPSTLKLLFMPDVCYKTHRRQRQADLWEFEASVIYRASSPTARTITQRHPVSALTCVHAHAHTRTRACRKSTASASQDSNSTDWKW